MVLSRKWAISLVLAILCLTPVMGQGAPTPTAYVDLKYQLIRQGLDKDFVLKVFADERNSFSPDIVRKIATLRKERPGDYEHFLKPSIVAQGRQYLNQHQSQLNKALQIETPYPGQSTAKDSPQGPHSTAKFTANGSRLKRSQTRHPRPPHSSQTWHTQDHPTATALKHNTQDQSTAKHNPPGQSTAKLTTPGQSTAKQGPSD